MVKHTQEPWVGSGPHITTPGALGYLATVSINPQAFADRDRIIDCVNALAGMNPAAVAVVVRALDRLVSRCDGSEGERADGSNIDTTEACMALRALRNPA